MDMTLAILVVTVALAAVAEGHVRVIQFGNAADSAAVKGFALIPVDGFGRRCCRALADLIFGNLDRGDASDYPSVLRLPHRPVKVAAALAVFFMMIRQANAAGQSSYEGMMQMYLVLTMAESILLMLVIPGLVGTALARDRERGALPVLQSSGISAVGMVSGKFLSCLGTALLYLVCGIPAVFLVYIYGGIPLSAFFGSLGVLILTAMFLVSVCLMISSLCPRAGTGAAVSYLVTAFLTVGTLLIHYLPVILFGASYGTSPGMKVPWYEYILLCNPVLTLYGILSEQTGNPDALSRRYKEALEHLKERLKHD